MAEEKREISLTHLSKRELTTYINRTSPFPFKGMLGGILHFIHISREHSVSNPDQMPHCAKRTLGLYGVTKDIKRLLHIEQ